MSDLGANNLPSFSCLRLLFDRSLLLSLLPLLLLLSPLPCLLRLLRLLFAGTIRIVGDILGDRLGAILVVGIFVGV